MRSSPIPLQDSPDFWRLDVALAALATGQRTIAHPLGMVVGMGTTTPQSLHIVRDNLTPANAIPPSTGEGFDVLRRTVNQENKLGKLVRDLVGKVGSLEALETLHTEPLPDEPFADDVVAEADHAFVTATIATFDEVCATSLDVEYRTAGRRLFARALTNQPALIRKSSRTVRFAAGLAHAVLQANDRIGRADGQMRAKDIAAWFGMSSAGDPAQRVVTAAKFERPYTDDDDDWRYHAANRQSTPSPDFLHSSTRARLIAERDGAMLAIEQHEHARAGRRPTVSFDDGLTSRRGSLADVVTVSKGLTRSGQTMLLLGFAPLVPKPELDIFVLTLAEAGRLSQRLTAALAAPTPRQHRIGDFDNTDDEYRYRGPHDSRYWL
jgi:hypothetical protein